MSATVYSFGEWLPDIAENGNPGLTEALNILPLNAGYGPFKPLDNSLSTLPATLVAGACVASGATKGSIRAYVFAGSAFYEAPISGASGFTARGSVATSPNTVSFAQLDNLLIASGENNFRLLRHTLGAASNFATLAATAPYADFVSVVNRFVVAGGLSEDEGAGTITASRSSSISWSGLDNPSSWPTPNSATAIAQQSGEQDLYEQYGPVTGIHGGDQFGVILQQGAVTRMTYVGPPVVFQFDLVSNEVGSFYLGGSIKAGGMIYFIASDGFCRTDGVGVERIGLGKVDRYFWDNPPSSLTAVSTAFDPANNLVYFAYDSKILIFNTKTGRWTRATQALRKVITPAPSILISSPPKVLGINNDTLGILGEFDATAGSATIVTGDIEINPGARAYVDGVKPNIESSGTAPAITVRVGYRNDLGTAPSYTATTTPTTRTGYADFRVDAKYHRAEVQIVGNFEKASGLVVKSFATGEA